MTARPFARHAGRGDEAVRANGSAAALRTDEVSRHAVRLVTIARAFDAITLGSFAALPQLLRAGDLLVLNDAATLPASLHGRTGRAESIARSGFAGPRSTAEGSAESIARSGFAGPRSTAEGSAESIELRLAAPVDGSRLVGVLFGAGDFHTRTEDRPPPPPIAVGDRLVFGRGALATRVVAIDGRRVELIAELSGDALWQAIYAAGAPVQYAHRSDAVPLYAVQTAYAARPWSAEMPSAGRPLTWDVLLGLRRAGIELATLTHAAGLSSTGDDALDRALPWPERYELPRRTIEAIEATRARGGRVIAVGTTVVRALEAAGQAGDLVPGSGVATLRIDPGYSLRVVDGLISGLHVPGESHFELLSAFAPPDRLTRALALAAAHGLSGHELGDACLIV